MEVNLHLPNGCRGALTSSLALGSVYSARIKKNPTRPLTLCFQDAVNNSGSTHYQNIYQGTFCYPKLWCPTKLCPCWWQHLWHEKHLLTKVTPAKQPLRNATSQRQAFLAEIHLSHLYCQGKMFLILFMRGLLLCTYTKHRLSHTGLKNKPCKSVFFFLFQNESINSLILRLQFFSGIFGEFETQVLKQYRIFKWEEVIGFSNKKQMLLHIHLSWRFRSV